LSADSFFVTLIWAGGQMTLGESQKLAWIHS